MLLGVTLIWNRSMVIEVPDHCSSQAFGSSWKKIGISGAILHGTSLYNQPSPYSFPEKTHITIKHSEQTWTSMITPEGHRCVVTLDLRCFSMVDGASWSLNNWIDGGWTEYFVKKHQGNLFARLKQQLKSEVVFFGTATETNVSMSEGRPGLHAAVGQSSCRGLFCFGSAFASPLFVSSGRSECVGLLQLFVYLWRRLPILRSSFASPSSR